MKKCIVNKEDIVVNIVEMEDRANWSPPEGCECKDGDGYIGQPYVPPTDKEYDTSSLNRARAFLLTTPYQKQKSVHIAGTNGKGSAASMIAAVLTESGYKTGLITKPPFTNECLQIDGRQITDRELSTIMERVSDVQGLGLNDRIVAVAFMFFNDNNVDFQVLETILGGTYDPTNVVVPEVAAITSIGYDHMSALGNTLAEIATHKAGIIKDGKPVVSAVQPPEAMKVIEDACLAHNSPLILVGKDILCEHFGFDAGMQIFKVTGKLGTYNIRLPLLGYYQRHNLPVAIGALEVLIEQGYHITPESIVAGMAKVKCPGRFEILARNPTVLANGATNDDAVSELRLSIDKYFTKGPTPLNGAAECYDKLIGILNMNIGKDPRQILTGMPPFDKIIVTPSQTSYCGNQQKLIDALAERSLSHDVVSNCTEALALARSYSSPNSIIVVTGSHIIANEAVKLLK